MSENEIDYDIYETVFVKPHDQEWTPAWVEYLSKMKAEGWELRYASMIGNNQGKVKFRRPRQAGLVIPAGR